MFEPYLPIIALVGLALLLILSLPIARIQKLILELSAWGLRLAVVALVAAAAFLWARPNELPAEIADQANAFLNTFPRLRGTVPEPGSPYFGACVAAFLITAALPLIAVLDVSRKLAGARLCRLRALTSTATVVEPVPSPAPVVQRVNRRAAAEALAGASSVKPARAY